MLKGFLWAVILCAGPLWLAGETVTVKQVRGEYPLLRNITYEEAYRKALNEAKEKALREAAGEYLASTEVLQTHNEWQIFNSYTLSQALGGITQYKITDQGTYKSRQQESELTVFVVIDAKVKKYDTKIDPSFTLKIDGLQKVYGRGEKMRFSVQPYQDGYLRIFLFEDWQHASQIFPNSFDPDNRLSAGQPMELPQKSSFYMTKAETGEPVETNHLVFVFTKRDIPFPSIPTYDNVNNWINGIELSERFVAYYPIHIQD